MMMNLPPKINIEPENDGLVQIIFLSRGLFSGSMLIFRGVGNLGARIGK